MEKEEIIQKETPLRRTRKKKTLVSIFSKISKKYLIIVFLVIVLGGLAYYFKNLIIVASVNGQLISRFALIRELEQQSGEKTLDVLITKNLILQEAKKQKVTVSDEEVNQEIKKIEESFSQKGQNLDQVLTSQGMTRHDFTEQIKFQKIIEKLVGKDVAVTDQEVNDYLEKNKDYIIAKDTDPEQVKAGIRKNLEQQKMNEKIQEWLKELRENSKINYFINF